VIVSKLASHSVRMPRRSTGGVLMMLRIAHARQGQLQGAAASAGGSGEDVHIVRIAFSRSLWPTPKCCSSSDHPAAEAGH